MRLCKKCQCSIENKHINALFCSNICKNSHWQLNNREKVNINAQKYRKSEKGQSCRQANKEKINKQVKTWKKENSSYQKELDREYHKRMKGNREYLSKRSHYEALRRAKKMQATPKWLTEQHLKEIKNTYRECPDGYHVDHIVPLCGENVSGLHVPWNLRIITAEENLKKSNKLINEVING